MKAMDSTACSASRISLVFPIGMEAPGVMAFPRMEPQGHCSSLGMEPQGHCGVAATIHGEPDATQPRQDAVPRLPTAVLVGTMRGGDGRVSDSCLTVITEVLADPCAAAAVS